jgi:hypothetical protein
MQAQLLLFEPPAPVDVDAVPDDGPLWHPSVPFVVDVDDEWTGEVRSTVLPGLSVAVVWRKTLFEFYEPCHWNEKTQRDDPSFNCTMVGCRDWHVPTMLGMEWSEQSWMVLVPSEYEAFLVHEFELQVQAGERFVPRSLLPDDACRLLDMCESLRLVEEHPA